MWNWGGSVKCSVDTPLPSSCFHAWIGIGWLPSLVTIWKQRIRRKKRKKKTKNGALHIVVSPPPPPPPSASSLEVRLCQKELTLSASDKLLPCAVIVELCGWVSMAGSNWQKINKHQHIQEDKQHSHMPRDMWLCNHLSWLLIVILHSSMLINLNCLFSETVLLTYANRTLGFEIIENNILNLWYK